MKKYSLILVGVLTLFTASRVFASSPCCPPGGGDEQHKQTGTKQEQYEQTGTQTGTKVEEEVIITCPMHPNVVSDKPGKCPKCGMSLEKRVKTYSYICPKKRCEYKSNEKGFCPVHEKATKKTKEMRMEKPATATQGVEKPETTIKQTAQYTCPMHPEVISDKPGKCPKCGMNLEKK